MSYPTCQDCGRTATDWVPVPREGRTVRWEPDLREVRPGVWQCWPCRRELHPDMPDEYVEFEEEAA
jgi:hypothetical protein